MKILKLLKSTDTENKFFNILFRALFKNSWSHLHPNLRFDNIYLRELLDILHKEMDEVTVLKTKGLPIENRLHYFLGTGKYSFWSGVRAALCHLLIGIDDKQGTVGLHSTKEDVLHLLNVFKTGVKTDATVMHPSAVQYAGEIVQRILDHQDSFNDVNLAQILKQNKRGGQGALPVKPPSEINALMYQWAAKLIDCQPGEKVSKDSLIEAVQNEEMKDGKKEKETHRNTLNKWWGRYKWFALNTCLFNKTMFGNKMVDVYEKKGIHTLLPSVVAAGSLNELQIKNIKKVWEIDVKPDLALYYVNAEWWKEYPELDKDFMTELAWVGYQKATI